MCILFAYVAARAVWKKPSSKKYLKFILAFNRDEQYARPSTRAHFWKEDPNIFAGQDNESRGTWLGINKKHGRLAAVTNIMGGTAIQTGGNGNVEKVSRGELITDFLRSDSGMNGRTYCTNLHQDPTITHKYNKFNFLAIDFFPRPRNEVEQENVLEVDHLPSVTYLTNAKEFPAYSPIAESILKTKQSEGNFLAMGNSVWSKPFSKVIRGCQYFQEIIRENLQLSSINIQEIDENKKDRLCNDILGLLKNKQKHWPDEQIQSQVYEHARPFAEEFSSNFVTLPTYGTRTHTIIFLDSENCVDFYEWTLNEPINIEHPTWLHTKFRFPLFSS